MAKLLYRFYVKGYNPFGFFEEYIIEANDLKNVCNLISDDFDILQIEQIGYSADGEKFFNQVPQGEKNET